MTRLSHTEGPWMARANGAQWVVDAGRKQRVASVNTALMRQEANALLIAAAPELLDAAEAVVLAKRTQGPVDIQTAYDLCAAAIAKARGQA